MTDARRPITPTRVIPAGQPLPAPAGPPPPPVRPAPPAPPASPDPPPWWTRPRPPAPPLPVPVDVQVTVTIDTHTPQPEPVRGPRWWRRVRIAYNALCALLGFILCGPWAWVLTTVRNEESLTGAWVIALIPLVVLAFWDNARRIEAAHADPDLWAPKVRALLARVLLWAALLATALSLPLTTLVYAITGVHT